MDELKPMKPVRLVIADVPEPLVWIGEGDELADITQAVERISIDVQPGGVMAIITARVDLEFDFPVHEVAVPGRAEWLDDVTAQELSAVAAGASMSEPLGEVLLRHLRGRAGSRP